MTIVLDPDNLDRFQVAVDPGNETISIRGLGTETLAKTLTGAVASGAISDIIGLEDFFCGAAVTGVLANDILTIVKGADIGHYVVAAFDDANDIITIDITGDNKSFSGGDTLVTNGGFTGGTTGWTLSGGWAAGTDDLAGTTETTDVTQDLGSAIVADDYTISYEITALSGGTVRLTLGDGVGTTQSGTGIFNETVTVTTGTVLTIEAVTSLTATIDHITVTRNDITYRVNTPEAIGSVSAAVADGATMQSLYSFLKEEWREFDTGLLTDTTQAEDLIKYTFPLESITREQFEIGGTTHSGWDFADDTTRNLIRTGGWAQISSAGVTVNRYSGVITLGTLNATLGGSQVYFQQHGVTVAPVNFVLTGPVNQAINTFSETLPSGGTGVVIALAAPEAGFATLTRADGGNWFTDGYREGGQITLRNTEVGAANDKTFAIAVPGNLGTPEETVDDGVDGTIIVVQGTLDATGSPDTQLFAAVDNRQFLKLFVRKKAFTYTQSTIADIGVTTLETIVNRFPLSHVADPAVTLDDGQLGGDGVAANVEFQAIEIVDAAKTDGATSVGSVDGDGDSIFTLTSAGSTFDGVLGPLVSGDTVEITDSATSDNGVYEIKSIATNDLVCFQEPSRTFTGGESSRAFTIRTGTRDFGLTNGAPAAGTPTADFASATSTFDSDEALGDRTVIVGDMLQIYAGTPIALLGVYKVDSVTNATTLVINTSDQTFTTETAMSYRVLQKGMHLQFKSIAATVVNSGNATDITFDTPSNTLVRAAGDWGDDGYITGMAITITGATNSVNNVINAIVLSENGTTTMTLIAEEVLSDDSNDAAMTVNGEIAFIRVLNGVSYPFNWRLFGNNGSLGQCFQFVQRELRRRSDIDEGDQDGFTTKRGDVNDLLMTFASPTGIGLNMFIDDLLSTDKNNATMNDLSGDSRLFAFTAGLTLTFSSTLVDDADAKIVVFFTDPDVNGANTSGNEFGTLGATVVEDDAPADIEVLNPSSGSSSFSFDFDNNVQAGRSPGGDISPGTLITVVAIGKSIAQYVQTTGTIARQNSNTVAVVAPLERNFSNP